MNDNDTIIVYRVEGDVAGNWKRDEAGTLWTWGRFRESMRNHGTLYKCGSPETPRYVKDFTALVRNMKGELWAIDHISGSHFYFAVVKHGDM